MKDGSPRTGRGRHIELIAPTKHVDPSPALFSSGRFGSLGTTHHDQGGAGSSPYLRRSRSLRSRQAVPGQADSLAPRAIRLNGFPTIERLMSRAWIGRRVGSGWNFLAQHDDHHPRTTKPTSSSPGRSRATALPSSAPRRCPSAPCRTCSPWSWRGKRRSATCGTSSPTGTRWACDRPRAGAGPG